MDEILKMSHFTPHVGKVVRFKGTPYAFVLDRVEGEDGTPAPGYVRMPFVVIFTSPSRTDILESGTYDCEVEGGPTFNMYVAPMYTPRPDRQEYQAVFN
jgi:uncharacterized protein DUF6916